VKTLPLLQKSVDAIYLCKPKRKGREDGRERSSPAVMKEVLCSLL